MIGILGLAAVIVATFLAYKTASGNGRNGPLWALATLGVGLGFQLFIPVIAGVILAVVYLANGTPADQLQQELEGVASVIGFACLFLSFIGIWLVLRHVAKLPEEKPIEQVPPPPVFENGDQ